MLSSPSLSCLFSLKLLPSEAAGQLWGLLSCVQEQLDGFLTACSPQCPRRPPPHCSSCQAVVTALIKLEEERLRVSFSIPDAFMLWMHLHGEPHMQPENNCLGTPRSSGRYCKQGHCSTPKCELHPMRCVFSWERGVYSFSYSPSYTSVLDVYICFTDTMLVVPSWIQCLWLHCLRLGSTAMKYRKHFYCVYTDWYSFRFVFPRWPGFTLMNFIHVAC